MELRYMMTTFPDNKETVTTGRLRFIQDHQTENQVINLYPGVKYQTFEGYGGAFTESAAYVYSLMTKEQKEKLIRTYFDADQMNYTLGRIHLDSCDFSLGHYEAMSDPKDTELTGFSIERMHKYVIPFLKDVQRLTGKDIELMAAPWSPPAFMKTNANRDAGGKLKPEQRAHWAAYICRYITELRKEGLLIRRLSIQNEPAAVQTWDSCIYTAQEEKVFLRDYLYPAMRQAGLDDIEIFIWDHNKERVFEWACEILDEDTESMAAGIAFHWYSGDHFESLQMIHERFPDKKLVLSEACIEYRNFDAEDHLTNAQKYAHDMIGNMNAGMSAFYDWNLLLDQEGGPNHVGNFCDAPFMYDVKNKMLEERNTLAYIRHFSKYIRPGAVRIGMSRYTTELEVVAFLNPDGTIAVVLLNRTKEAKPFVIRLNGMTAEGEAAPDAIMTLMIQL